MSFTETDLFYLNNKNERRQNNTKMSTRLLRDKGIPFESFNDGAHLFVAELFDFWPSTGLYINRKTLKRKRGVFTLIKEIGRLNLCTQKKKY